MKKTKLTALIMTLALAVTLLPMAASAAATVASLQDSMTKAGVNTTNNVIFQIDNKNYLDEAAAKVMDVEPFLRNDRTLVPVRYFGEALGGEVFWDSVTKQITITLPNGSKFDVTNVVILKDNRSFMPLNLMRTNLGMTVDWIGGQKLIVIHKDTLTINTNGQTVVWERDPATFGKDLGNGIIDLGGGISTGGGVQTEWIDTGVPNGSGHKF